MMCGKNPYLRERQTYQTPATVIDIYKDYQNTLYNTYIAISKKSRIAFNYFDFLYMRAYILFQLTGDDTYLKRIIKYQDEIKQRYLLEKVRKITETEAFREIKNQKLTKKQVEELATKITYDLARKVSFDEDYLKYYVKQEETLNEYIKKINDYSTQINNIINDIMSRQEYTKYKQIADIIADNSGYTTTSKLRRIKEIIDEMQPSFFKTQLESEINFTNPDLSLQRISKLNLDFLTNNPEAITNKLINSTGTVKAIELAKLYHYLTDEQIRHLELTTGINIYKLQDAIYYDMIITKDNIKGLGLNEVKLAILRDDILLNRLIEVVNTPFKPIEIAWQSQWTWATLISLLSQYEYQEKLEYMNFFSKITDKNTTVDDLIKSKLFDMNEQENIFIRAIEQANQFLNNMDDRNQWIDISSTIAGELGSVALTKLIVDKALIPTITFLTSLFPQARMLKIAEQIMKYTIGFDIAKQIFIEWQLDGIIQQLFNQGMEILGLRDKEVYGLKVNEFKEFNNLFNRLILCEQINKKCLSTEEHMRLNELVSKASPSLLVYMKEHQIRMIAKINAHKRRAKKKPKDAEIEFINKVKKMGTDFIKFCAEDETAKAYDIFNQALQINKDSREEYIIHKLNIYDVEKDRIDLRITPIKKLTPEDYRTDDYIKELASIKPKNNKYKYKHEAKATEYILPLQNRILGNPAEYRYYTFLKKLKVAKFDMKEEETERETEELKTKQTLKYNSLDYYKTAMFMNLKEENTHTLTWNVCTQRAIIRQQEETIISMPKQNLLKEAYKKHNEKIQQLINEYINALPSAMQIEAELDALENYYRSLQFIPPKIDIGGNTLNIRHQQNMWGIAVSQTKITLPQQQQQPNPSQTFNRAFNSFTQTAINQEYITPTLIKFRKQREDYGTKITLQTTQNKPSQLEKWQKEYIAEIEKAKEEFNLQKDIILKEIERAKEKIKKAESRKTFKLLDYELEKIEFKHRKITEMIIMKAQETLKEEAYWMDAPRYFRYWFPEHWRPYRYPIEIFSKYEKKNLNRFISMDTEGINTIFTDEPTQYYQDLAPTHSKLIETLNNMLTITTYERTIERKNTLKTDFDFPAVYKEYFYTNNPKIKSAMISEETDTEKLRVIQEKTPKTIIKTLEQSQTLEERKENIPPKTSYKITSTNLEYTEKEEEKQRKRKRILHLSE